MKRFLLFFIILILSTTILKGQKFGNIHIGDKWFVKTNFGVAMYWGDIQENWKGHLKIHPVYEIGIGKELNSFLSLENSFLIGNIEGYQSSKNRYFKADFFEYSLSGVIDISTLSSGFNAQRIIQINGILGIGFINYNSILKTINSDSTLNTTSYDKNNNKIGRKTDLILKTGFNLTFKILDQVDLLLENTWSFTGSDNLDGFSGGFNPFCSINVNK